MIDFDLYVGKWPFNPLMDCEPAQLCELLKRNGIHKGLVTPLSCLQASDCLEANTAFFDQVKPFSDYLLPVLALNPLSTTWEEACSRFWNNSYGIKLFPGWHDYFLDDPKLTELYQTAADSKKPIIISMRFIDMRNSSMSICKAVDIEPEALINLAANYPGVNFIFSSPSLWEAYTLLAAGKRNIFVTISSLEGEGALENLCALGYGKNMLWGSNYPFYYIEATLAKTRNKKLDKHTRELIAFGNANRLFGI
ncbi:MAG: amidohydrolase family protein [bacterium]|nr:amidohydrolase family protein [bacterium]